MVEPGLGQDRLETLPEELERALSGWRELLEPTPEQLEASSQRVRHVLSGLPSVAPAPPARASTQVANGGCEQQTGPRPASGWRRRGVDRRRTGWALSSGAAVALMAAFALGRRSAGGASRDPQPLAISMPAVSISSAVPVPSPALGLPEVERSEEPAAHETSLPARAAAPLALEADHRATARRARSAESIVAVKKAPCQRQDALLRAECWLRRGRPEKALEALPGAPTGQEREREQVLMLRLVAKCQLGQDVRALAARFFAEWPDSPLALRIRNECPRAARRLAGPSGVSARAR